MKLDLYCWKGRHGHFPKVPDIRGAGMLVVEEAVSDSDYARIANLAPGEHFVDADGDKWVRTH